MSAPLPRELELHGKLHVGVPAPLHPPEVKGVVGHRLQRNGEHVRIWGGLRVSTPELMWCELGATLTVPDLVAVGDHLIHWRLPATTIDALRQTIAEYPGRRGRSRLRQALELLDDRSESRRESHLRVILVPGGVRGLVSNLPITTRDGTDYRADFAIPQRKVIIEYQSDYHRDPVQFRKDMTRIAKLEADGWYVMQVNSDDLAKPAELVDRILHVLAGRPDVA